MSDPPPLLEARCTVFLRRLARQISSAAAAIENLTGERPHTSAEVVVLAAELLGEPAEELLAITPGELLQKLQALIRDAPDSTAAGPYAALRAFARNRLKGQERAVIEALCDAGGELSLSDMKTLCDWQDPIESAWNSLRIRVNKKLQSHGWKVRTQGRAAILKKLDTE